MKQPAVYIMANKPNGTLYVGVTSDLIKRAFLHRNGLLDGRRKAREAPFAKAGKH